ncbi:DUF6191 domain-containing protein [Streptomyces sp. NBC_01142]|uniref:DUF6191 domain-containing protein n=1 Tax=Streptomyces sp. NBC_01142 TaxID=2975865 RepID=UPI002B1DCFCF|nr:DUF6191 domain-containing protein [Streptomyces sp. NBC_01142]
MFNAFDEFFAPGRRHTDEERNRLALTRSDTGDNDPSRGPIDLTSGKVSIRPPKENPAGGPGKLPGDDGPDVGRDPVPDEVRDEGADQIPDDGADHVPDEVPGQVRNEGPDQIPDDGADQVPGQGAGTATRRGRAS